VRTTADGVTEDGPAPRLEELAHEIKNPLNCALNGAAALQRRLDELGLQDEALTRAAGIVASSCERIHEVVDRLARRPEALDLRKAVEDTVRLMGARVSVEASGDTTVVCRPGPIRQALLNLLINAIQANERGRGRTDIHITGHDEGVVVSVRDEGPGVPDLIAERIFDPGFTTKASGTGLGLAVAARVAEEHGGRLVLLRGSPGATFELSVPRT